MPVTFLISLSTWIVVCLVTRYVSVASIAAALILPLATWGAGYSLRLIFIANLLAALAVYKHLPNVGRLLNGTENKLGRKTAPPSTGTTP